MLKKFLKLCSFILSIVLLVNMLPLQIYALELDATDTVKPVTGETSQDVTILGEITEKRTEYTKEFRLSNGLNLATVYAQPVHYNQNGQWKEIDNTLVATTAGFKNTSGVWDVTFPQNMRGSNGVTIHKDGHTLSFYMSGQLNVQDGAVVASTDAAETFALQPATEANAQVQQIDLSQELKQAQYPETVVTKNYSRLQYSGVFASTDIVYDLAANQVKESIIIQRADASLRGYRYILNTGDMIPVLEDSGEITLYDKDKKNVVMVMPVPFLQDSDGMRSYDVTVQLSGSDGAYTLSYILPHTWMQAEDRQYPIILDPIVEAGKNRDNIEDTTVFENPPAHPEDYTGVLKIGKHPDWGIMRAYVKFLTLPELADTDIVVEATFSAKVIGWFCPEMAACVHKLNGTWEDINDLDWASQPSIDTEIIQDFNVPDKTDTVYKWDVTEIVRDWYLTENTGLVLRGLNSLEDRVVNGNYMVQLASEEYSIYSLPGLSIAYRSVVGVEPYYTYATMGVGNAGGVYLSDNSGQITVMRPVASYASTVNPFAANLVYNSAYFVKNSETPYKPMQQMGLAMDAGAGWTLDLVQKLESTTIGETAYLRYYDGDGTIHYLKQDKGIYYDEDGLGLEVVANSDGSYTMSDAMDNTWKFTALAGIDGFFLTSSLDNNGNGYTLTYTDGKLTSVAQNNRNQSAITVATFGYNADGYLTSVTDAADGTYILNYSAGKLTQIQRPTDETNAFATYGYAGYRLTSMADAISKYSLNFAYFDPDEQYPNEPTAFSYGRVRAYWESYTDNANVAHEGVRCDITYPSYTQTIYHSYGLNRTREELDNAQSDDLYHNYLFDYAGRTVNAYTTDACQNILGASTAVYTENDGIKKTNNRTERTATIGVPAQKLLRYCEFESNANGWELTKFARATTKKHTGYYALKATLSSVSDTAVAHYPVTGLSPDKTYTLSAYVRTADLTLPAGSDLSVYLEAATNEDTYTGYPVDYLTDDDIEQGWVRICITFTPGSDGAVSLYVKGTGAKGSFYVDDVQLEVGEAPSNYNLLENGNMEYGSYAWYQRDCVSYVSGGISGNCMQITGDPADSRVNSYQTVTVNRTGHQSYVLSGWAKADAVTDNITIRCDPAYDNTKQFGLRAKVTYSGDSSGYYTEYYYVPFNPDVSTWQYASLTITPEQTAFAVDKITVTCVYESNANIAWFDDLSLVSTTVQQMEYDENGNPVTSVSTGLYGQTTTYDSNGNVASVTTRTGTGSNEKIVCSYTYDSTFVHRVLTSTTGLPDNSNKEKLISTYTYDEVGNLIGTVLSAPKADNTVSSSATYTSGGNLIASSTDAAGNTVSYAYAGDRNKVTGQPSAVTDPGGTTTAYQLDGYGRTEKVSLENIADIQYTYSKNLLTKLTRTTGASSQAYSFAYDDFGNATGISIVDGTNALALMSYEYGAKNGLLTAQTYGNGDAVSFTYDILGRAKTAKYFKNNSSQQVYRTLTYTYTGDGQLYQVTDSKTGYTYIYDYDSLGRLNTSTVRDREGNKLLETRQVYDANDQLTAQQWTVGDTTYTQTFTYSKTMGNLTNMSLKDGEETKDSLALTYDALQRLSTVTGSVYGKTYTYRDISDAQTTSQVAGLTYDLPLDIVYGYTYDQLGNIATYTQGGYTYIVDNTSYTVDDTTYTYTYDAQNQLTQQTGGGITYTYTYDGAGNILSASDGINTHTYKYGYHDTDGDSIDEDVWKDLLIQFDGQTIKYDLSGNPTDYYNGTDWDFTWEEGRNLVSAKTGYNKDTKTYAHTSSYTYDSNGLRLTKEVVDVVADTSTSTTYNYFYAGGKLMRQTDGTNTLDFFYDESGHPYALTYNGTTYYYVTNLQGDVLHIVDSTGALVVSYSYDPYGKPLTTTGSMAATLGADNPLRYRGYVYDQDTGFYYLQSRYYDPTIGRFINADVLVSTKKAGLGCNLFTYCFNNSVNYIDAAGTDAIWIQEWDSASDQGHTGLMVQDEEGNWFYFYWGPAPENEENPDIWELCMGVPNGAYYVQYIPDESSKLDLRTTTDVIEAVNKMFEGDTTRNRSSLITNTVYIEGNFQKTHQYIQALMDSGTSSEEYNLILNNCVQKSMYALSLSDIRFAPIHIIPVTHGAVRFPLFVPAVHPNIEFVNTILRLAG